MTVNQLYKDGILELPLVRNANESFREFLFSKFQLFIDKINQTDFPGVFPEVDKERILTVVKGIQNAVNFYLDGYPQKAFDELSVMFDQTAVYNTLVDRNHPVDSNLYRLRVKESNYPMKRNDLFHVPFDLRHLISTQRFSIPGFPCLYVSNSIYVAWEEMRRPKLTDLQAIRLQNTREIHYLDLTTDVYSRNFKLTKISENELVLQLLAWPIIASCSVKVLKDDSPFKPEYIIPQLLLQWVRGQKKQNAIKFSSTHIDLNHSKTQGSFYNFVIPVKTNGDSGVCKKLSKQFKLTDVVSWQLLQVSLDSAGFIYDQENVNDEISKIEIIHGMAYPYDYSPLADMERMLTFMPLSILK